MPSAQVIVHIKNCMIIMNEDIKMADNIRL